MVNPKRRFLLFILGLAVVLLGGALFGVPPLFLTRNVRSADASAVHNLRNSILAFFTEYRRFPSIGEKEAYDQDFETDQLFMAGLLGAKGAPENPRGITFFTAKPAKSDPKTGTFGSGVKMEADGSGAFYDRTGNFYRLRIDANGDGSVHSPIDKEPIPESVIVWGAGKDGKFETWKDNVKSW